MSSTRKSALKQAEQSKDNSVKLDPLMNSPVTARPEKQQRLNEEAKGAKAGAETDSGNSGVFGKIVTGCSKDLDGAGTEEKEHLDVGSPGGGGVSGGAGPGGSGAAGPVSGPGPAAGVPGLLGMLVTLALGSWPVGSWVGCGWFSWSSPWVWA